MSRQTLIHLHTSNVEDIVKRTLAEVKLGEIAVMHAATEQALFTKVNDSTLAKFITETAIDAKISSAQTTLQGNIDAVVERVGEVESLLGIGEVSGETISSRVEALEGAVSANTEAIEKEVEDREAAIDTVTSAVTAEAAAREAADQALDVKIGANADAIAAINNEETGILKQAKDYTDQLANGAVKDNTDAIAAINNAETGILKQAKDYADEKVQALADGAVKTNTEAIALLNGDAETAGSVAHAVAAEAAAREAAVSAETAAREAAINAVNSAITAEAAAREAADQALDVKIGANADAITTLQGQVEALNSATHFRGVFESLDLVENPAAGDVVVIKKEGEAQDKEYIYDAAKGWIELGDTTAEQQRLTSAEGRLDAAEGRLDVLQGEAEVEGSVKKALADAKAYADEKVKALADGAVKTNTEAIAKEVEDRIAAVSAETVAREAAVNGLQGQIDGINTTIEENEKVTSEALNDLNGRMTAAEGTISGHTTDIANNASAITAEATAREEADEALQAAIDKISVTGSKSYEGGPDSVVVSAAEDNAQAYVVKVVGIDCGEY